MSLGACADIVRKGDPDRFAAAMAAPAAARAVLFPIYAFNVEVARAPWVASEPLIGAMRLQWWADALGEIAGGAAVRRHEVTTPLAGILDAEGARILSLLVAARRYDLEPAPFAGEAALGDYLDATGAGLMWAAARALGATDEATFRTVGRASALANLFLAVPALAARGRHPLPDDRPGTIRRLAVGALALLGSQPVPRAGRPAALAAWRARTLLARAAADPGRVARGALAESEFRRRLGLVLVGFRG